MHKLYLRDRSYAHANSLGVGNGDWHPDYVELVRDARSSDIEIFTDQCWEEVHDSSARVKIAWLLEPPVISPRTYRRMHRATYRKLFDYVLTYDAQLLKRYANFHFYPFAGSWIHPNDHRVHSKSKQLSIIASAKRDSAGHRLRHAVIERFGQRIDCIAGRGYQPIEDKLEALADYGYSLVIENQRMNYYFTEKLIDCFATGTIPIYWGCPAISRFFDADGMYTFRTLDELPDILDRLSQQDYQSRLGAVQRNMYIAKRYRIPEDWIWHNFLKFL